MTQPGGSLDELFRQAISAIVMAMVVVLGDLAKWWRSRTKTEKTLHAASERGLKAKVLLAELGTRLHADIGFVEQFHNGDHYVSGSELLRKSRTHEWTAMTVKDRASEYQNVPVSLVHDECELIEEEGPSFRRTDQLEQGSFRRMLEAAGVVAIARCALRHKGDIVGFVGVDFLHTTEPPPRINEVLIYAARIEQALFNR